MPNVENAMSRLKKRSEENRGLIVKKTEKKMANRAVSRWKDGGITLGIFEIYKSK